MWGQRNKQTHRQTNRQRGLYNKQTNNWITKQKQMCSQSLIKQTRLKIQ